jgi:co-chaperonin GroES (HSP10)
MNKYGIEALNDHVVVELIESVEETSEGGIIIPQSIVNRPQKYGIVISVGPSVEQSIQEGDLLIFAKHGGQDIILNNIVLKVLKVSEIYGKVKQI